MADYGLTSTGFLAKSFEDIVNDLKTDIKNEFGVDLDSTPDNKFKVLVNILSTPLAENWASVTAMQSMMDIDQAGDIFLDYLCASKLIYRQDGVRSTGIVTLGLEPTSELTLPQGSEFFDINSNTFQTTSDIIINSDNLHGVDILFDETYTGDLVSITINGIVYSTTATAEGSYLAAIEALEVLLVAAGYAAVLDNYTLTVFVSEVDSTTDTFSLQVGLSVSETTYYRYIEVQYEEVGEYVFLSDSLTTAPSFSSIASFTNTPITGGRYRETDEELRARFKASSGVLGKATASSVSSAVRGLEGVTNLSVVEHVDVNDVLNNSVEVVVKGGNDLDIANKLYEYRAAGVRYSGNQSVIIKDVNSEDYEQQFTRVVDRWLTIRVGYTKYEEEEFPVDGETTIQNIVKSYVDNLEVGNDVIGGRIRANIYKAVDGIENITVEMFSSLDPLELPTSYQTSPVRVSVYEEAAIALEKITVYEE